MSALRRSFSDEPGHGTFHALAPPRRRPRPVFHLAHDNDDDDSLDEAPPARSTSSPPSPRAVPLTRGASAPVLLSNGKPLKPSLKSSSSPAFQQLHLRARSEPSTPKNVHFPEQDYGLATVRVFNRKARPAALSSPNGTGDETETEGEDVPPSSFPFPTLSPTVNYEIDPTKSSFVPSKCPPSAHLFLESLHLSSSAFSSTSPSAKPLLTGSILVRNLAFEKHVAVRFTLDDWQTVSEVSGHYVGSLPPQTCPSSAPAPDDPTPLRGRGWDRFAFTIRLEDYALFLSTRTIWLAARYRVSSTYPLLDSVEYGPGGEWWDNNGGANYRVGFRPATVATKPPPSRPRRETVSAPTISPRAQPPVPTASMEHALGLMIPAVRSNKATAPMREADRRLGPLRVGKLDLCNYVPPTVHATSTISFPSTEAPSSPTANPELSSAHARLSSDEESASPTSSTLSTPSTSPTITPRVIVGGQPATCLENVHEEGDSGPVHLADWEWSAPSKAQIERVARQCADPVPALGMLSGSSDKSLFNAFVTHWCFAHGPSPGHHGYDEGGIMA